MAEQGPVVLVTHQHDDGRVGAGVVLATVVGAPAHPAARGDLGGLTAAGAVRVTAMPRVEGNRGDRDSGVVVVEVGAHLAQAYPDGAEGRRSWVVVIVVTRICEGGPGEEDGASVGVGAQQVTFGLGDVAVNVGRCEKDELGRLAVGDRKAAAIEQQHSGGRVSPQFVEPLRLGAQVRRPVEGRPPQHQVAQQATIEVDGRPDAGTHAQPTAPTFSVICLREGFVSAVPSGNTTVGTVWLPPLTVSTKRAADWSCSMSTSSNSIPARAS
ncbi:unannotated protein [freshwater metagenome]|uniref:Unannotated protein n=1 Tax=freshwater metagenome TaxID=449393 RepID=A0A6J7L5L3_9ZZZZ